MHTQNKVLFFTTVVISEVMASMDMLMVCGNTQSWEAGLETRGENKRLFRYGEGLSRQSLRLREYSFSGTDVWKQVLGFDTS